jgi:hypothetical protein
MCHAIGRARALRPIYSAASAEGVLRELDDFERGEWVEKYLTIAQSWRRAWQHVIPFLAFPPLVRKVIYTINVIESLHMQLRKISCLGRASGRSCPADRAAHQCGSVPRPRERSCFRRRCAGSSGLPALLSPCR